MSEPGIRGHDRSDKPHVGSVWKDCRYNERAKDSNVRRSPEHGLQDLGDQMIVVVITIARFEDDACVGVLDHVMPVNHRVTLRAMRDMDMLRRQHRQGKGRRTRARRHDETEQSRPDHEDASIKRPLNEVKAAHAYPIP